MSVATEQRACAEHRATKRALQAGSDRGLSKARRPPACLGGSDAEVLGFGDGSCAGCAERLCCCCGELREVASEEESKKVGRSAGSFGSESEAALGSLKHRCCRHRIRACLHPGPSCRLMVWILPGFCDRRPVWTVAGHPAIPAGYSSFGLQSLVIG